MGLRPEAPAELHRPLSTIQACLLASGGIHGYSVEWNGQPETVKLNATFAVGWKC